MGNGDRERHGLRAALVHRDLRLVFSAFVIASSGGWAFNVALLSFVFAETHSAGWLSAATAGRFLPALLFSPYGGVVAERFERIRLMISLDLMSAGCMAGLLALVLGHGPIAVAIAIGAVAAMLGVTYEPALAALVPQLVPEDDLAAANSVRGLIDNGAVIVGPAVGALMVAIGGVSVSFAMTSLAFLCSAALVSRVRTRSRPVDVTEGGAAGPLKQMRVGFLAIASTDTARVLVAFSVVASFIYGTDTVLFVLLSTQRLGTGANGFGYLMAGLGVGGIIASVMVPMLAARSQLAWIIVIGLLTYCVPTLLMIVVGQPAIGFAVQVLRGAGTLIVDVLAVTALQRSLPEGLLARVFGAFFALVIAAIATGSLLTPVLVHSLGLNGALVVTGAVVPALALAGLPALLRMDRENALGLLEMEDVIAVLERTSLLDGARRVHLEGMAANARRVDVPAGAVVIRQGDAADALFVLLAGRCAVSVAPSGSRAEGRRQEVPDLMPGDVFGEIGLLRHSPRTATVAAVEPTSLLSIAADAFLTAVSQTGVHPTLQEATRLRLARTPAGVLED